MSFSPTFSMASVSFLLWFYFISALMGHTLKHDKKIQHSPKVSEPQRLSMRGKVYGRSNLLAYRKPKIFGFLLHCWKEGGAGTYSVAALSPGKPSDLPTSTQSLTGRTKCRIMPALCPLLEAASRTQGKQDDRNKESGRGGNSHSVITFHSKVQ